MDRETTLRQLGEPCTTPREARRVRRVCDPPLVALRHRINSNSSKCRYFSRALQVLQNRTVSSGEGLSILSLNRYIEVRDAVQVLCKGECSLKKIAGAGPLDTYSYNALINRLFSSERLLIQFLGKLQIRRQMRTTSCPTKRKGRE